MEEGKRATCRRVIVVVKAGSFVSRQVKKKRDVWLVANPPIYYASTLERVSGSIRTVVKESRRAGLPPYRAEGRVESASAANQRPSAPGVALLYRAIYRIYIVRTYYYVVVVCIIGIVTCIQYYSYVCTMSPTPPLLLYTLMAA